MDKVGSWQSTMEASFKTCYQVSSKVVNGVGQNLRDYGKFAWALDLRWQSILCNRGSLVRPSKGLAIPKDKIGKAGLFLVPLKFKLSKNHRLQNHQGRPPVPGASRP